VWNFQKSIEDYVGIEFVFYQFDKLLVQGLHAIQLLVHLWNLEFVHDAIYVVAGHQCTLFVDCSVEIVDEWMNPALALF
jgi:hypothetical protein